MGNIESGLESCCRKHDKPLRDNLRSSEPPLSRLGHAARMGDEQSIQRILLGGQESVNSRDHQGWTALHHAASQGHTHCVRLLVDFGSDLSAKTHLDKTPMALAMDNGHHGLVEFLLKATSNTRGQPSTAYTPVQNHAQVADVEALHAEAAEKYFNGDYNGAEVFYKKALALNPQHLRSLCNYGALLHNVRHDHDKAEQLYKAALAVSPNDVVTLYNYALLLEVAKQDYLGAEKLYLRALQVDPMHVDTLVNYGSLLKTVHNELATAEKMYQTALVAEPDHIDALCNYALLLRDGMNQKAKAKELISRALAVAPDDEWLQKHASAF